jgi:hypothetical protein
MPNFIFKGVNDASINKSFVTQKFDLCLTFD